MCILLGVVLWNYQLMHGYGYIKLRSNDFNKIMHFSFFM